MPFHVGAYTVALGTVANTDVAALADGILFIQNAHFLPQRDMSIVWAWAGSATLSRARFNSPKLRQFSPAFVRPISLGAITVTDDNVMVIPFGQLVVRGLEELAMEATSLIAMGTERFTCMFGLMDRFTPAPMGDVINLRFTGTTTLVANAWSLVTPVYDQQLPAGTYSVIGGELQTANSLAWRLTFDDQYLRPGLPAIPLISSRLPVNIQPGTFGEWGRFRTTNMPRLEVLANGASTTQEGYLQIVRVA